MFVDRALPGRPRHGADPARQAPPRRGDRLRAALGRARSRRGAVSALRHLRRLPLAGPALRAAARAQAAAGARRAAAHRRAARAAARADRSRRARVRLPQQARVRLDDAPTRASRSASTARAAGRRSFRSRSACSRASAATPCARRSSRWAREQGLEAFDQRAGTGYLRHLVVREGVRTGELLCILVTVAGDVPDVEGLEALLAERAPGVVGVLHAVNDGVAEVASGIPTRPLFGRAWFEEEISGLAPARLGGLLPADQHRDGRRALPRRDRAGRPERRRDGLGPVLRHRLDRACAGGLRAPRDRRRDRRGGRRARARERARQRRRQHPVRVPPTPARRRAT